MQLAHTNKSNRAYQQYRQRIISGTNRICSLKNNNKSMNITQNHTIAVDGERPQRRSTVVARPGRVGYKWCVWPVPRVRHYRWIRSTTLCWRRFGYRKWPALGARFVYFTISFLLFLIAGYYNLPKRHGKLKEVSRFDEGFFGIVPKQANVMDPQLRILLEVAYEAILDAG